MRLHRARGGERDRLHVLGDDRVELRGVRGGLLRDVALERGEAALDPRERLARARELGRDDRLGEERIRVRTRAVPELREELLKSEKLTSFFEDNPSELHHLRHDGELKPARTQAHLRHVPDYLLPTEGKKALTTNDVGFVPFKKLDGKNRKGRGFKGRGRKVGGGRKVDPLKSLRARSKKK